MDTELERNTAFFHLGFQGREGVAGLNPSFPTPETAVIAEELGPFAVSRDSEPDALWVRRWF